MCQQPFASLQNIHPSGFKITRVPRVGHITRTMGVIHQQADFVVGVLAKHALQVAEVVVVHGDDVIVIGVVLPRHLAGGLALAADAVLGKFAPRWRIDGIADFFGRSGGRSDLKLLAQAGFFDEVFHHKLGHGTAADVAVTDEEDLYHVEVLIVELLNCCADAGLQAIVGFFVTKPTKLSKLVFQGWESSPSFRT